MFLGVLLGLGVSVASAQAGADLLGGCQLVKSKVKGSLWLGVRIEEGFAYPGLNIFPKKLKPIRAQNAKGEFHTVYARLLNRSDAQEALAECQRKFGGCETEITPRKVLYGLKTDMPRVIPADTVYHHKIDGTLDFNLVYENEASCKASQYSVALKFVAYIDRGDGFNRL